MTVKISSAISANSEISQPKNNQINIGMEVKIEGEVHFIMTLGLREAFIIPELRGSNPELSDKYHNSGIEWFDKYRGSEKMGNEFKKIQPVYNSAFQLNAKESESRSFGNSFSSFRQKMNRGNWLLDTFKLIKEDTSRSSGTASFTFGANQRNRSCPTLPEITDLLQGDATNPNDVLTVIKRLYDDTFSECNIRFSRLGLIEVHLIVPINKGNQNVIEQLVHISQLEKSQLNDSVLDKSTLTYPLWYFTIWLANKFISSLSEIDVDGLKIRLNPIIRSDVKTTQSYMIILAEEVIETTKNPERLIDAKELWENHKNLIAAILEGSLAIENNLGRQTRRLPLFDEKFQENLQDFGSWSEECCVFGSQRCFIYSPKKLRIMPTKGLFQDIGPLENGIEVKRYWEIVIRGIAHCIVVRNALQILEKQTTDDMGELSDLISDVSMLEDTSLRGKEQMQNIANRLTHRFAMLPHLRDVMVPTSVFKADYATSKYSYLIYNLFQLEKVLEHIHRNVDEALSLLQYSKSVTLHEDLSKRDEAFHVKLRDQREDYERAITRENDRIAKGGVILAMLAIILTAPSYFKDSFENRAFWDDKLISGWIIFLTTALIIIGLIGWFWVFKNSEKPNNKDRKVKSVSQKKL
jgi:hypothetical protein